MQLIGMSGSRLSGVHRAHRCCCVRRVVLLLRSAPLAIPDSRSNCRLPVRPERIDMSLTAQRAIHFTNYHFHYACSPAVSARRWRTTHSRVERHCDSPRRAGPVRSRAGRLVRSPLYFTHQQPASPPRRRALRPPRVEAGAELGRLGAAVRVGAREERVRRAFGLCCTHTF